MAGYILYTYNCNIMCVVYIYTHMQVITINKNRGQDFEREKGVICRWVL